jgi:pantoate--beta-alanine ligase
MVEDLNFGLEIVGCPIIREEDGLAKSSRNTYLSKEEREAALILSKSLKLGSDMMEAGEKDVQKIVQVIKENIEKEPLAKIDYVEIVSWPELEEVSEITGTVLCAMAVYIGKTRLIDNIIR